MLRKASSAHEVPLTDFTHTIWRQSAIGKEMTDADARELLLLSRREDYAAGEELFTEGDPAAEFFLIVSGEVDVIKRGHENKPSVLATLGAGSILGETSLLTQESRSATARAKSNSTILRVRWEDFEAFLEENPAGAYKIVFGLARLLAIRLKRINAKITDLTTAENTNPAPETKLEEFANFKQKLLSDWSF